MAIRREDKSVVNNFQNLEDAQMAFNLLNFN